jgi:RNA polymerase sigma-70 factor (ECF subfamily)
MHIIVEWISLHGDFLYSYAFLKTNNKETAEDLVQETLLSAYKSIDSFKGDSSPKTWLMSILKYKIIDYYRKTDLLKNSETYLQETEVNFDSSFFEETFTSTAHWKSTSSPQKWHIEFETDDGILRKEILNWVHYCIDKIPLKLRPVFFAKFMEERDAEEICKEFEISSSNYWVMLHRAKLLMRACLEKHYYEKKS